MLERHAVRGDVPAPCHAFVVVSFDNISAGIRPYCDCWGNEDYVFNWYSFIYDPLEDIYPEMEALYIPGLE